MKQNTPPHFYVIGHKNPDTDAICSAIGHAALLRVTGNPEAVAARCGELRQRTLWALEQAGIEPPVLVTDVRTTAGAICHREVIQVGLGDTFLTAYRRMLASGIRCVPVTDSAGTITASCAISICLNSFSPARLRGSPSAPSMRRSPIFPPP